MHHSLRFYSRNRRFALRFYMLGGAMTRLPLVGRLARYIANLFGEKGESAYLLTPAEAELIIDQAGAIAVGPCACRSLYKKCDNPVNTELLIGAGREVFEEANPANHREITREEARGIIREAHKKGLIQTIIRCRGEYYALCNCCSCCCVPIRLKKQYDIGNALRRWEGGAIPGL